MRIRRLAASVTAVLIATGGMSAVTAPSASAADLSDSCAFFNYSNYFGANWVYSDGSFYAGEQISILVTSMDSGTDTALQISGQTVATGIVGEALTFTFPADYLGPGTLVGVHNDANWHGTLSCSYVGIPLAAPAPIPMWVQGYARQAATDVCLDGWVASWEMWPHGGTGGWVCTRSIPSIG